MKDHMKNLIKNILFLSLFLNFGCEKPYDSDGEGMGAPEPQNTYQYDGKEYPVNSIIAVADESQIFLKISPIEDADKQTTYAIFGVNASLDGQEVDVENAWHNDDYYFVYEDPLMYYSQYRKLTSGKIFIKRYGDAPQDYEVLVDVILPDGKRFYFKQN